ncbi:NADPH-dependent 7-cyano-7-deazaguanine reductase QueF [Pseudidiomarina aestuarii]|uniref:NADPH-dependent 7-cyano-7-deazaguanine reductase n=1 Tax=Pseudidiomarina aestuarii TaxID=624146 RepID=A0A7Z6ZTY2_9GAMM|nr:NADPH-dependent 7-cyano-7-deazaguanine reductase QueF [Pseudidiomarina aestuarii]RUO41231.1 NADPH-dependent 7-cyano-7-deazaguanine reductase QueF [Pseudidiomarina aestuarii]
MTNPLGHLSLGQPTQYPDHYDATLLQAVPRQLNREPLGLNAEQLPFTGVDYWNAYEMSWLNQRGLPQVAIVECQVPIVSPNLIESKSFKLYLNSFNESRWDSWQQVQKQLEHDLSDCAGATVKVQLLDLKTASTAGFSDLPGLCIDHVDVAIQQYHYEPQLLRSVNSGTIVEETLHSHLLKSNCLITNQPDWGSVLIRYRGQQVDYAALLQYIVSFRNHNEFHEQCVERIFVDMKQQLQIEQLTVYARYTRRGGLDINPFRSDFETAPRQQRLVRQ